VCPFTEGLSVYQARGLMRTWDDSTFYYNSCENNIPEEINNNSRFAGFITSDNSNPSVLMIYPNPTNGLVYVKTNTKDCIFEVNDITGRKVMSQKLNEVETKIDVSTLNSGTYFYKITQNTVVLKADKLIINK
jgi:hypothetical protein